MTKLAILLSLFSLFPAIILACPPSTGLCLNNEFITEDGHCLEKCNTPLIKGKKKLCKPPCNSLDDFIYPDGSCLPQCPVPFESTTYGSFKLCQTQCKKNQFVTYDGQCKKNCPSPFLPQTGNGLKLCACPANEYADESGNCGSCPAPKKVKELCCSVQSCVKPCPSAEKPYYDIDNDICLDSCPSGQWSNINDVDICSAQPTGNVVAGTVRLDADYQEFVTNNGEQVFKQNLALALGIDESLIRVIGTREGSVIIEYEVISPSELGQPATFESLQQLAQQISAAIDSGALVAIGEKLNSDVTPVGIACADGLYLDAAGECVADCGDIWKESVYGDILFCAKPCELGEFWREDLGICQATCIAPSEIVIVEDVEVCRVSSTTPSAIHALLRYPISNEGIWDSEDLTTVRVALGMVEQSISAILSIDPSEVIVIGVLTDSTPITSISVYINATASAENLGTLQAAVQNGQLDLYGTPISSSFAEYDDEIVAPTLSPEMVLFYSYSWQVPKQDDLQLKFDQVKVYGPILEAFGVGREIVDSLQHNFNVEEGEEETDPLTITLDIIVSYKLPSSLQNIMEIYALAESGMLDWEIYDINSTVMNLSVQAYTPSESSE